MAPTINPQSHVSPLVKVNANSTTDLNPKQEFLQYVSHPFLRKALWRYSLKRRVKLVAG